MSRILEEMRNEVAEKAKAEGNHEKAVSTSLKLLVGRDSMEEIAEITGLSLEEVRSWQIIKKVRLHALSPDMCKNIAGQFFIFYIIKRSKREPRRLSISFVMVSVCSAIS